MKNSLKKRLAIGVLCATGLSLALFAVPAEAEGRIGRRAPARNERPTIVLVHGAFADGSSWRHVVPILQRDGYTVTAVQNPCTSLKDDVAATRRLIKAQPGPVVVVAHSYGGMVATGAAAGMPNVKALVYVAAYAPDAGESIVSLNDRFAPAASGGALLRDPDGYLSLDRKEFHRVFCRDVPLDEAATLAAVQKPLQESAFGATLDAAAWRTVPSWFLVSHDDMVIRPELERFEARRMGARTVEIRSSHVAMISHPREVSFLIEAADRATR